MSNTYDFYEQMDIIIVLSARADGSVYPRNEDLAQGILVPGRNHDAPLNAAMRAVDRP